MIRPYKIVDVVHSGRKGKRGKKVTAEKYEGIVGCTVLFDINDIGQFSSMKFLFKNHPTYDCWSTSEVLAMATNDDRQVYIETANSIYIFEPLFDED